MREIELVVIGVEAGEEVETFVQRAVGLGIGFVDLVQHHDRTQAQRQRLGGDEFGLRHRAFSGIDQQDHAIDHRQDTLDLAAEIGVAGGVDDVDAGAFPFDAGGLGEDGDPAFALQIVGVHGALIHGLIGAEGARLLEKLIDKRGLAVVDVSDDRDVAQVHMRRVLVFPACRLYRGAKKYQRQSGVFFRGAGGSLRGRADGYAHPRRS